MKFSRPANPLLIALAVALGLSCSDPEPWEGVVQINYRSDVVARHVKRRLDLLRAGVRLRDDLAVARVWRNPMDYTFIARRPTAEETGIASLQPRRRGVPVSVRPRGIDRKGRLGICEVHDGYWIIDLFSSLDAYLASVVVPEEMSGRSVLQHLGIARKVSERSDRVLMTVEERLYWRELLPVVVANDGYGHLFISSQDLLQREREEEPDSLKVMGKRYELAETDDYLLVGRDLENQRSRHVFTLGGRYLMSILQYDAAEFDPRQLLRELNLENKQSEREDE
jgi:hypothetical protein